MTELLFTYGLLRKGATHVMSNHLEKHASFVSKGTFKGKIYLIDYYPGVIPSTQQSDQVVGDVFKIADQRVLEELDQFEGIGSAFSEPTEYIREKREIQLADETIVSCWIYLYNWDLRSATRIKSGDFLAFGN